MKWTFLNERLMAEGAVFRTEKDNARETDPANANNIVAAGNQLVKGAQFSIVGRLPRGMDIAAGYAYLDSAVIYSKFFAADVQSIRHAPAAAAVERRGGWELCTASSTVPFVPTGYAPNPNGPGFIVTSVAMKQVPGYWIFDAMLRRPITERLELQANANNLLNRYYIDLAHPSHLIPGSGANALIGINFKF